MSLLKTSGKSECQHFYSIEEFYVRPSYMMTFDQTFDL